MADIRTSFYYDPIRQGYDTNSWRTLSGAPAVNGTGRIVVDAGTGIPGVAIHYGDLLKGDIVFNVIVPSAPGSGDLRAFGVSAPGELDYIKFLIGSNLTCETAEDGVTDSSPTILWDSAWTGVNVEFRIRWEAGRAVFFINDTRVYAVSGTSVPAGPLSLYLYDNSASAMAVGEMYVRGTQSFVMNPKTSDSTINISSGTIIRSESITITENIGFFLPMIAIPAVAGTLIESITISENANIFIPTDKQILNDSATVSENIVILIPTFRPSVSDTITVSENKVLAIV